MAPRHYVRDVVQKTNSVLALHIEFQVAVTIAHDLTGGIEQLVVNSIILRIEQVAFEHHAHSEQTVAVVVARVNHDVANTYSRLRNDIDIGRCGGLLRVFDLVGCAIAQNANSE